MRKLLSPRGDRGFSLVEVMVATSLLGVVLMLVYGTLNGGVRQAADAEARVRLQTDVRAATDGFVRDLRQAYTGDPSTSRIATMTANQITFYSPDKATPFHLRKISYRLNGTRWERSATLSTDTDGYPWVFGTTGAYVLALDGVRTTTLFTYHDADGIVTSTAGEVAIVDLAISIDVDTSRPPAPLIYGASVDLRGVT